MIVGTWLSPPAINSEGPIWTPLTIRRSTRADWVPLGSPASPGAQDFAESVLRCALTGRNGNLTGSAYHARRPNEP